MTKINPLTQFAAFTMQPVPVLITGGAAIAVLALLHRSPKPPKHPLPTKRFSNEEITQRFVASIPQITQELNLELATATQIETFSHSSQRTWFWKQLNLGTSTVLTRVPVTYRYHVHLHDGWKLEIHGDAVTVHAPVLHASLPPAIHTDQMERISIRGWGRGSTTHIREGLEKEITPLLCRYATDIGHLDLVRDRCRRSVAEFVRHWLTREQQWGKTGVAQIRVKFADEAAVPLEPTLSLPR